MGLGLGSNPASAICPWRPLFPHLWRGVRPAAPRERWEARAELTSGRTEGSGQAWASERGVSALRQPGRRGQGPPGRRGQGPAEPYLPGTLPFGAHLAAHNSALGVAAISLFQNGYFSTRIFHCRKQVIGPGVHA